VSVAIKKVEGVESVDVSLNEGFADIKLRDGNKVTVEQMREVIRKNGFTPKESMVKVRGKVIERNGKPALEVGGQNGVLLLTGNVAELAKNAGKEVVVSGVIPDTAAKNEPETIDVKSVSAQDRRMP
jgi:copper chaperone CopZ